MPGRILSAIRSLSARFLQASDELPGPYRQTAGFLKTVPPKVEYVDGSASRVIHSAFRDSGMFREQKVTIRDIHRFRIFDEDGDIGIIGFISSPNDFNVFKRLNRMNIRVSTSVGILYPGEFGKTQFGTIPSRWRGGHGGIEKPVIAMMHGSPRFGGISLRRPAHARATDPAGHVDLDVDGTTAANMLWETRSFQTAIHKNPNRPLVGAMCSVAGPSAPFGMDFSARMFENGFTSPIYLPTAPLWLQFWVPSDGTKNLWDVGPVFRQSSLLDQPPIVEFLPPQK